MSAEQPFKQEVPAESAKLKEEAEDLKDAAALQALSSEPYAVSDGELNRLAEISEEDEKSESEAKAGAGAGAGAGARDQPV